MNSGVLHRATLCAALLAAFISLHAGSACAQTYHNIVNQRFRTVSNGPQSAIIVDVDDPKSRAVTNRNILDKAGAYLHARNQNLERQLNLMKQRHMMKPNQTLVLCDTVILRHNGRLILPTRAQRVTRAVPNNAVTFHIVTKAEDPTYGFADGTGANSAAETQGYLDRIVGIYNTLLGPPLWNGTVRILNKDVDQSASGAKVHALFGTLLVIDAQGNIEIDQPAFTVSQDRFMGLAQAVAQAFHGPNLIAYDAWEKGMARAAAVVAARSVENEFQGLYGSFDPVNDRFYTPYYDLLNQPSLSNNTFEPPTKTNQALPYGRTGGMTIPRLQMASTVWLKAYIENNAFFRNFNDNYYNGLVANPNVKNDVNALRGFASAALPNNNGAQIEGDTFNNWFERQYILDTSVTPGAKVYVFASPRFPATGDPAGANFFLVYFRTIPLTGDEQDLSGVVSPTYFDYSFQNRVVLGNSNAQETIANGELAFSVDFTGLGTPEQSRQRLTIDFPVNNEYTRLYFPANEPTDTNGNDNGVSGVLVGSNTGNLTIQFGNTRTLATPVAFGAFGIPVSASDTPEGFYQTTLVYTPTGGQPIVYKRNVYQRMFSGQDLTVTEVAPIFVLTAPAPNDALILSQSFNAGPQMISLPIAPYTKDLAAVLGTDPKATLLAQYRQDNPTDDKYVRYPSLPLYQPGYGLWADFGTSLNNVQVRGQRTDTEDVVTIPLQFGWNQIGNPFAGQNIDISNADAFQILYLNDVPFSFADAVSQGYVGPGVYAYNPATTNYENIADATATTNTAPANQLVPWRGYWFLVTVPEGITLTYVNPSPTAVGRAHAAKRVRTRARANAATSRSSILSAGWRLPLVVRDGKGNASSGTLGQAARGSDSFVSSLDAAMPPALRSQPGLRVRFPHTDWSNAATRATDFLSDVRRSGTSATWDVAIDVPQPGQSYSLEWNGTAKLPRGTRLMLVDVDSGSRQLMNSSSSYQFTPSKGVYTRHFQIVAEPKSAARVWVRNLRIDAPVGGVGRAEAPPATISYEMSGTAEASIAIRGSGGRVIRHLATGRAVGNGLNQAVWDLRNDQGQKLPAGLYIIEVIARTPEGEQYRAIATHQVVR